MRLIFGFVALVAALGVTACGSSQPATTSTTTSSATSPAKASTKKVNISLTGTYTCTGTCAKATGFKAKGSGSGYKVAATGKITGANSAGCYLQTENYTISSGSNRLTAVTTSDKLCKSTPTVYLETGDLRITGGTGKFVNASGTGAVKFSEKTEPQVLSGTIQLAIA